MINGRSSHLFGDRPVDFELLVFTRRSAPFLKQKLGAQQSDTFSAGLQGNLCIGCRTEVRHNLNTGAISGVGQDTCRRPGRLPGRLYGDNGLLEGCGRGAIWLDNDLTTGAVDGQRNALLSQAQQGITDSYN